MRIGSLKLWVSSSKSWPKQIPLIAHKYRNEKREYFKTPIILQNKPLYVPFSGDSFILVKYGDVYRILTLKHASSSIRHVREIDGLSLLEADDE